MTEKLSIHQKILKIREAIPHIQKKRHSFDVKYAFAKIDDIFNAITPKMNELGVNFHVSEEKTERRNKDGAPEFVWTVGRAGQYGDRILFVYEADLTCEWINTESPEDRVSTSIHAIAWNDDPAKAKGAAWTYALKYYFFQEFCIDQGDADPDNFDQAAQNTRRPPEKLVDTARVQQLISMGTSAGYSLDKLEEMVRARFSKELDQLTLKEFGRIMNGLNSKKTKTEEKKEQPKEPIEEKKE